MVLKTFQMERNGRGQGGLMKTCRLWLPYHALMAAVAGPTRSYGINAPDRLELHQTQAIHLGYCTDFDLSKQLLVVKSRDQMENVKELALSNVWPSTHLHQH